MLRTLLRKLTRRKQLNLEHKSEMKRCLGLMDLTALGVGSTLGAGVYVVTGEVARDTAGPSIVLSYLFAAICSFLSGICYAEFGARIPTSGSAYAYSYVSVGESIAFVIGWNLILSYVIGTASVARSWSESLDRLLHNTISDFIRSFASMHIPGLAEYPDFVSFILVLFLSVVLAMGVKEMTCITKIFTGLNISILASIFVSGLFKADFSNWDVDKNKLNETMLFNHSLSSLINASTDPINIGNGGFFPFGVMGTFTGAASCFYAFVGFDVIATTGEEALNPSKNIPISIMLCLVTCLVAYMAISAVATLIVPYFLLNPVSPFLKMFEMAGWPVVGIIVTIGSMCALSTSLIGGIYPMPRIIYAMAEDRLLFPILAKINQRFKTPFIATIVSGFLAGFAALLFDFKILVDFMSIGTLLSYTMVSLSVLMLRYKSFIFNTSNNSYDKSFDSDTSNKVSLILKEEETECSKHLLKNEAEESNENSILQILFKTKPKHPNNFTESVGSVVSLTFYFVCCVLNLFLRLALEQGNNLYFIPVALFGIVNLVLMFILWRLPQNKEQVSFKVPFVPLVPCISIFVNVYLMIMLSFGTWVKFFIWLLIGFAIYFSYSIRNSAAK